MLLDLCSSVITIPIKTKSFFCQKSCGILQHNRIRRIFVIKDDIIGNAAACLSISPSRKSANDHCDNGAKEGVKWNGLPPSLRPSKSCFRRLKSDIGKVTVVCFTDGESKPALPFDELARPKGALGGRLVQGHLWPAFNYITKLMKKKFFTIRFDSEVHKNKTFVFAAFSKKIAEPPCKVNLSETPWGSDTFALLFVSSDLSQICPRPSVSSGVSRVNLRRRNTTPSPSDCQIGRELAEEKSDINTDYGREKRRGRATSVTRSSPTPN